MSSNDWDTAFDVLAAVLLLGGSFFALMAAIGVLRLPDLLSRMHAATKPQVIGMMLVVLGLAARLRDLKVLGFLLLIVLMQMMTSVVAGHMVGRASYRSGQVRRDLLVRDDLTSETATQSDPRGAP